MSRAERIAAMCGIGIAATLAVFVLHLASFGWLLGLVTGWLLCIGVYRRRA